ncbi:MAG: response regulator [Desulfobacterales bacterium]|nr:response regulator [Desulfobacterales bacterium]
MEKNKNDVIGIDDTDTFNFDDVFSTQNIDVQFDPLARLMGKLDLSSAKFLIVDPNKQIRVAVKQMLKKGGFKDYEFAGNGYEALKFIQKNMANFIICEWELSRMSGIDLLKLIKSNPKYFFISFIMISSHKSMKRVIYAVEEGADGFILKPFTEFALMSIVKKTIEDRLRPDEVQHKINEMTKQKLRHKYDKALAIGYDILKDKTNATVSRISGECFYQKQEYDKAIVMLKESLKGGKNSKTLQLLGKVLLETGKEEEAINYFRQALTQNPINKDSNIDLIRAYLKQKKTKEANEIVTNMMESDPSYLHVIEIVRLYIEFDGIENIASYIEKIEPIEETLSVFYDCAIKLGKNGNYDDAIKILEICDNTFPESHFIKFNLGVMYYQIKKYDKALYLFKYTLKLNSRHEKAKKFLDYISKMASSL